MKGLFVKLIWILDKLDELLYGPRVAAITERDIRRELGEITGSEDAKESIKGWLIKNKDSGKSHKVIEEKKIELKNFSVWILRTRGNSYLVAFKSGWLWNYGKLFNQPETEGTGLNEMLAKYCIKKNIITLMIVKPDGKIYAVKIKDLVDYATEHKTIRKEKEGNEMHVPVGLLRDYGRI